MNQKNLGSTAAAAVEVATVRCPVCDGWMIDENREETNLRYCIPYTRKYVEDALKSPGIHFFTKLIIREGLTMDCVDAVNDVEIAFNILRHVMYDITGRG